MIISVANQKGGVGKTTSTYNISVALSNLNKKVLMIDFDPQSSLSISAGFEMQEIVKTIYAVLCEKYPIEHSIHKVKDNLYLIPSIIDLSVAEMTLVSEFARESILKKVLEKIKDNYDFIIIDCPPSLGLLTINALCASDKILMPVSTDYLALRGLYMLILTVYKIKDNINENLEILGVIPTMYDSRTLHSKEILDKLKENYSELTMNEITKSVKVKDAVLSCSTIVDTYPNHKISIAYKRIAEVIING